MDAPVKKKRNTRTNKEKQIIKNEAYKYCQSQRPKRVSLRNVYYHLEGRGFLKKTLQDYKVLSRYLVKMRREGEMPYDWIFDETCEEVTWLNWQTPQEALQWIARNYSKELWADMGVLPMIWCEKRATKVHIESVCQKYQVPVMIAVGFSSESLKWDISQYIDNYELCVKVFGLFDFDASGEKIYLDMLKGVEKLIQSNVYIEYETLALTEEQIEEYNLPTRLPKQSSHSHDWRHDFSVEIDALDPLILEDILEKRILQLISEYQDEYDSAVRHEKRDKDWLRMIADQYGE